MMKIKIFSGLALVGLLGLYSFYVSTETIDPTLTPIVNYLKPTEVIEHHSGMDMVDCIYVINLDKRTDKWKYITKIFEEQGLKINRFSAFNGWALTQEQKQELSGPYPVLMTGGHYGCFLSQVSVLKDAYDRGFNVIWVCEDDVEFVEDINLIPKLLKELTKIDPDWDIFYTDFSHIDSNGNYLMPTSLSGRPDQPLPPLKYFLATNYVSDNLLKIRVRYGMHSMLISKKGMKKILDYMTHAYIYSAIDCDLHYIPTISQYCPTTDIVSHLIDDSRSDTWYNIKMK